MKTFNNILAGGFLLLTSAVAQADQVILDDLIVDGSICAGFDCVNGESFGFDTLRLKENNLRIRFQDTSSSASFPTNDWQLTANDTSNGGANKFSIDDIDGGRTPFTIEAGAPTHSLYVDDGGRLGLGTSTPVVDVHTKTGNTPTLRLEQDGSSGFAPQTWDVAGNEANFFIRDATNGSTLPFRVFPGAPSNALTIEGTTGDIGIGTTSPTANVHVVETTAGESTLLQLTNSGAVKLKLENSASDVIWGIVNSLGGLRISKQGSGFVEMEVFDNGNMTIQGALTENSDINAKTSITEVDNKQVLNLIEAMPIHKWEYKDARGEAHIGPMAQDFYAAFGLGGTELGISTIDTAGVALVAIKALSSENHSLRLQLKAQEDRLRALEGQQVKMQTVMTSLLEAIQAAPVLTKTAMN